MLVPDHSYPVEAQNLFFRQLAHAAFARPLPPQIHDPRAQRVSRFRYVFRLYVEAVVFPIILFRLGKAPFEREFETVFPNHSDLVQKFYLFFRQYSRRSPRPDVSLRLYPAPERQTGFRLIPFRHVQVFILVVILLRFFIHQPPRRGERIFQRFEQLPAFAHLVVNFEPFVDDLFPLSRQAVVIDDRFHFPLHRAYTVEVFKIIDDIEYHGTFSFRNRQRPADLLFIYDRGYRRPEQDHPAHVFHVHSLVEHIYAVQQFQMFRIVLFELSEFLARFGIF